MIERKGTAYKSGSWYNSDSNNGKRRIKRSIKEIEQED